MMKLSVAVLTVFTAFVALPALADSTPTPNADASLAGLSMDGRTLISEVKSGVTDWPSFCKSGPDGYKSETIRNGTMLKSHRTIIGFGAPEIGASIKYFTIACRETGN